MTQSIIIQNQTIQLDPAQLIQSGGEGLVFKVGQTAVKRYHHPQPHHQQKLTFLFDNNLVSQLPPNILAPSALATDKAGNILGFQMPLLPTNAVPIKFLSKASFWQKHGITTTAVLTLFLELHATLTILHNLGIVVGDLNDQNVFITPTLAHFLIDVDSYQFGRFPCPVAMELFVDPNLYGIADLSKRPFFSPATDWYAFFVLLVRSLLHIHPYGGVHHAQKSIAARATAGISILHPDVVYPANARPRKCLSDTLLQHVYDVFELGSRRPFSESLLLNYANNMVVCNQCRQEYAQERPFCPFCITKQTQPTVEAVSPQTKLIYTAHTGYIDSVHTLPNGRFLAIHFAQEQYKLIRFGLGGVIDEMVLFNGRSGYQFATFQDTLVVNPPGSKQLLLLDVGGTQPQKRTMLETAMFTTTGMFTTAIFAATPHHLYRIAGNWIMRGTYQNGQYIEEAIATAHRQQTWFQASSSSETIAGYHRIFAENRFFLWHEGQYFDVAIPPLQPEESLQETAVSFTPHATQFILKINQQGRQKTAVYHCNHQGKIQQHTPQATQDQDTRHIIQTTHATITNNTTEIQII